MQIKERSLHDVTYAVVDFETTGLSPVNERVVEVSVVHLRPGSEPKVVLDTLVDPRQPMSATWVHGITDDDVRGAPTFEQILPALEEALAGTVLVSHNVYFDVGFLLAESRRLRHPIEVPHLCTMYLRPLLGLGKRAPLLDACQAFGIPHEVTHRAQLDALATAQLLNAYLMQCRRASVETFGDLAKGKNYKFLKSFALPALVPGTAGALNNVAALQKSRSDAADAKLAAALLKFRLTPTTSKEQEELPHRESQVAIAPEGSAAPSPGRHPQLARYLDAVAVIVEDLDVTEEEAKAIQDLRSELKVTDGQVRAVHAQIFSVVLSEFSGDMDLDWAEQLRLSFLHQCLKTLGWAPGE